MLVVVQDTAKGKQSTIKSLQKDEKDVALEFGVSLTGYWLTLRYTYPQGK